MVSFLVESFLVESFLRTFDDSAFFAISRSDFIVKAGYFLKGRACKIVGSTGDSTALAKMSCWACLWGYRGFPDETVWYCLKCKGANNLAVRF